jgi:hypothetical protein
LDENNDIFNKALRRFTMDVAADGAIKKLYHQGYKPEEIKEELDFPVSIEYIRKKIEELENVDPDEPVFERAYTSYGKPYFILKKDKNGGQ